jgi:hypothetical protein
MQKLDKKTLINDYKCLLDIKMHAVLLDSPFTDAEEMVSKKFSPLKHHTILNV